MQKNIVFMYLLLCTSIMRGELFKITTPGPFTYGVDIQYTPTFEGDSVFIIASDNVQFNAGYSSIMQTNTVGNLTGILVEPGYSNISITDVVIQDITGSAIVVEEGCSNIAINNVKVNRVGGDGFDFNGMEGFPVDNSSITNCDIFSSCTNSSASTAGIVLNNCTQASVSHVEIYDNGNSNQDFIGIYIETCTSCVFLENRIGHNLGLGVNCFEIINSNRCQFSSNRMNGNMPLPGGSFVGMRLTGTYSAFNAFSHCIVEANNSDTSTLGFLLEDNTQNNTFTNCTVSSSRGGIVRGIELNGINSFNNIFRGCTISENGSITGEDAIGVHIIQSNFGILENCFISYNNTTTGIAVGLQVEPNAGNNWVIRQNNFIRNRRTEGMPLEMNNNSYGVRDLSIGVTTFLYMGNLAYNNGTNSALKNQYFGVPVNVIFERTSINLPSIGGLINVSISE